VVLARVLPFIVEPELVGPSLIEEALEVAAEVFQLVELVLHEPMHRLHVARVGGVGGELERCWRQLYFCTTKRLKAEGAEPAVWVCPLRLRYASASGTNPSFVACVGIASTFAR